MKILARAPNWIGDAVMCLPALEALSARGSVSVTASGWVKDLFLDLDYVHEVIPLPRDSRLRTLRESGRRLRAGGFDHGVLFTNSFASALLFRLAGIPERWGFPSDGRGFLLNHRVSRRKPGRPRHQIHDYLDLAAAMGAHTDAPRLSFPLTESDHREAQALLQSQNVDPDKPLVILNPGAYFGPAKRWPVERYAELAGRLLDEYDAAIGIIGSEAEAGMARRISSLQGGRPHVLAGHTSLRSLAGLLRRSRLCVTNDSGPMHLAVALNVPTVAVFGPTDPVETGPLQEPSVVLKRDVVCWPCAYRDCPFDHRCMRGISSEDVLDACRKFLG